MLLLTELHRKDKYICVAISYISFPTVQQDASIRIFFVHQDLCVFLQLLSLTNPQYTCIPVPHPFTLFFTFCVCSQAPPLVHSFDHSLSNYPLHISIPLCPFIFYLPSSPLLSSFHLLHFLSLEVTHHLLFFHIPSMLHYLNFEGLILLHTILQSNFSVACQGWCLVSVYGMMISHSAT